MENRLHPGGNMSPMRRWAVRRNALLQCPVCGTASQKLVSRLNHVLHCKKCGYTHKDLETETPRFVKGGIENGNQSN